MERQAGSSALSSQCSCKGTRGFTPAALQYAALLARGSDGWLAKCIKVSVHHAEPET